MGTISLIVDSFVNKEEELDMILPKQPKKYFDEYEYDGFLSDDL